MALLGDLAFLYDAGALLGAAGARSALTRSWLDNDGGGIFSFLPQAAALPAGQFERYWGTPHGVDVGRRGGRLRGRCGSVETTTALDAVVAEAAKPGVRVAVLRGERAANVAAHDRLHAAVAAAVRRVI